jgi:Protein of unknown function (DUF2752)
MNVHSRCSSVGPREDSITAEASAVEAVPLPVRVRRALLVAAGFGAAALLLGAGLVPCTFARVTHIPCPGCGSTRAVYALLRGDLHGVLRMNPLGPLLALLIVVFAAQTILQVLRDGHVSSGKGTGHVFVVRAAFVLAVLEFALWVARFFGVLGGPVPV